MILLRVGLLTVLVGIAYLSLSPTTSVSVGNDKVGHFIAYSVLTTNLGVIYVRNRKKLFNTVLFALCYGALMEWGQAYVPGRTASFYDMIANATGVLIGLGITLLIGKRIRKIFVKTR